MIDPYPLEPDAGEPGWSASTVHAPSRLWEALVRAAYEIGGEKPIPPVDGRQLAQVVERHEPEPAYDGAIAAALARLAVELPRAHVETDAAAVVRTHLSGFCTALQGARLRAIARALGEGAARRDFLDDASRAYPCDALVRLVAAAADDAHMSEPLARMLEKLSAQTRIGPAPLRAGAERALREQVRELVAEWWPIRTGAMGLGFDDMFHGDGAIETAPAVSSPEPERVVRIALRTDAVGVPVWGPVTTMLARGHYRELLDLLREAPEGSDAAREIVHHVATPQNLSALLAEDEVDVDSVERIVPHMGLAAAPALLDRLATAESRATRRVVFDQLARLGTGVGPAAFERLDDERWFVRRNLLALLAELGYWPDDAAIEPWIGASDPRVRREAVRALMRVPRYRDTTLMRALRDESDRQTLRLVLSEASENPPDAAIPAVVERLADESLSPDLRVAAVRLLGASRSPAALDALLRTAKGGRTLLGRPKVAPKSSEVLAALRALARRWAEDRRAAALLERARASRDDDIARAAGGES